jgi:hypothetical protein
MGKKGALEYISELNNTGYISAESILVLVLLRWRVSIN